MPLEREFKSVGEDGVLRSLKVDEVVEVLEGPRKESYEPIMRLKGKASSDDAVGWLTVRDKTGTVFAEADSKYYQCTSSVAITDNRDIKECKVLRKLAVGELFIVEEGPVEEGDGMKRALGRTAKDDITGWITIKGNAGSAYAEASSKHYSVVRDVPLTKKFPSASPGDEVRTLAKGEAVLAIEAPKTEAVPAETRARVKAVQDNSEGWITVKPTSVAPWTPFYKCKFAAPIHETLTIEGATVVREASAGESFELLEGPVTEGTDLRMKARAE